MTNGNVTWPESMVRAVERSAPLNSLGKALTKRVSSVVRPGTAKDALSGTWLGHPLHPVLTDLPIGAWTSALLLDLLGDERTRRASDSLVGLGVVAAVPAAVTGASDLADVVHEDERSVGAAHALGNVAAVVLFGSSFLARTRGRRATGRALSALGATVLAGAGFLGGHLSYRRGIGVDQTAFQPRVEQWTPALVDDELPPGQPQQVTVSGTEVLLYRQGQQVCALANRCTHRGGPLHKGRIEDGRVTCPWHLSTFSLEDGVLIQGPATAPQPAYESRIRDGRIEIRAR